MDNGFIGQFTGLLVHPRSTLASLKTAPLRSALIYFLVVWVIFATLYCIVGSRLDFYEKPPDLWFSIQFVTLVLAGWLFFGLVIHAILRIITGPKSIGKTYMALFYSMTPLAAIGWIAFLNGLSFIWGLLIINRGIGEYHDIPGSTSFLVMFLSILIGFTTFLIAYYYLPLVVMFVVH